MPFPRFARISVCLGASLLVGLPSFFLAQAADADTLSDALPHRLGLGLRQVIAWHRSQARNLPASQRRTRLAAQFPGRAARLQTNADVTRVVVDITLDGTAAAATVRATLTALGAEIFAGRDAGPLGGGMLSARLPLDAAEAAVATPGVQAIALVHRPWSRVGKATTQGAVDLGFSGFTNGLDGTGITVGVISDSFDAATVDSSGNPITDHAAQDIASGDLPGPGNPLGHTTPVVVLADGDPADTYNIDEGRAMLQIVHDLVPGATLAFATDGGTPESLAANIRSLRTSKAARCDVIVDDLTFPEEPMFYDGTVALAVDDVTHSATLAGRKVLYYSAAGNSGDLGYTANFQTVSNADARAGTAAGNLHLDQVPAKLTSGGFHNFDTKPGKLNLVQKVTVGGSAAELDLQWDDGPPNPTIADADYNVLVFDAAGNYLPDLSGTDDNTAMHNSVEIVDLPAGDNGGTAVYQLVISRAGNPLPSPSSIQRLRYVVNSGSGQFTAKFAGHDAPTLFGHAVAPGADAVAAYYYASDTFPERYSSLGPATIYFDHSGVPLATPEVRQQPTMAAVDGVDTTFFPPGPLADSDSDGDGLPNFFGTSAAAPHAAAAAVLLLQAAGGPGSLSNEQVRTLLQSTATAAQFADPNLTSATAHTSDGTASVTLQEVRDDIDPASKKNFFRLSFTGPSTASLNQVTISVNQSGVAFDTSTDAAGAPFAVNTSSGGLQKSDVSASFSSTFPPGSTYAQTHLNKMTVRFAPGTFLSGGAVSFGAGINNTGDPRSLDPIQWMMIGTELTARIAGPGGKVKVQASANSGPVGSYTPSVGAGLINVGKAIGSLNEFGPPATPDTYAALTAGNVLLIITNQGGTSGGGRLYEVTPKGQIVQSFQLPAAAVDKTDSLLQSTVLAHGKIATVGSNLNGAFLLITDPATRDTRRVTYPGQWIINDRNPDCMTSIGDLVFVHNDATGRGTLLRYDVDADAWQGFGGAPFATGFGGFYYEGVVAGKDGLLYAVVDGPTSMFNFGDNEVYDPVTLQQVGTFSRNLGYSDLAFDQAGNGYVPQAVTSRNSLSEDLLRLSASGAVSATGNPGDTNSNILAVPRSIQVGKDGTLFAALGEQVLISDVNFSKFKVVSLTGFGDGGELQFYIALIDP